MLMFSVREYQLGNIRPGGDWAKAASGSQQRATLASAAHSSVAPEVSEPPTSQARTRYTTPRSRRNRDARRGSIPRAARARRNARIAPTRSSYSRRRFHGRPCPRATGCSPRWRTRTAVDEDHIERRRLRGAASSIGVRGRACGTRSDVLLGSGLMTRAVMPRSHERFRCSAVNVLAISAAAGAEDSTATSSLAPRLNASMPSAPVPANRSNTRASSSTCHESRCENIASLVRSVVGRVPVFGVVNATPLNRPEITCMTPLWPPRRNDRNRTTGPGSYVPYIRRLRYATQLAHMPHML